MTRKARKGKPSGSRCYFRGCVDSWRGLRTMTGRDERPTYSRCPGCDRTACGIHSVAATTSFIGKGAKRRLGLLFSPPLCEDCARPVTSAMMTLAARARRGR